MAYRALDQKDVVDYVLIRRPLPPSHLARTPTDQRSSLETVHLPDVSPATFRYSLAAWQTMR